MSVVVTCATAAALIAEGAICLNADTGVATREGQVVPVDSIDRGYVSPILVCGSTSAVESSAEALEADGLPAWRVAEGDGRSDCCRNRDE